MPCRVTRVVALAVAGATAAVLGGCGAAAPAVTSSGSASTAASSPAAPSPSADSNGVGRVGVGAPPVGLAFAAGSVWVAVAGAARLDRVDPATGTVSGTVSVRDTPLRLQATPAGLWVSEFGAGTVALIDPARQVVVRRVAVGAQPEGLASDGTHLWVVLQAADRLVELDARSGALIRTVALPGGGEPRLAVYAPPAPGRPGTVWVNDYGADRLVPVQAANGRVGAGVQGCAGPQAMAVAPTTLWAACLSGKVVAVDLTTHRVTATVTVGSDPDAVAVAASGAVWVGLSTGPAVAVLNPATGALTGRRTLADTGPLPNADVDVLLAAGQVWVSSWNGRGVLHVPLTAVPPPG